MSKCESNIDELIVPELARELLGRFRQGSLISGIGAAMLLRMFPSWRQPLRTLRFAG